MICFATMTVIWNQGLFFSFRNRPCIYIDNQGCWYYLFGVGISINFDLNNLKKNCFRKSEFFVERISFYNVIENLVEHGTHCLPCSFTNDVINVTTMASFEVKVMSPRY